MKPFFPLPLLGFLCIALKFANVFAFPSAQPIRSVGHILPKSRLSEIKGLLVRNSNNTHLARQEEYCPIAGGIICNSVYCCEPGTVCQPNNPAALACCSTTLGISCNGGTACCERGVETCCASGCCLSGVSQPTATPSATVSGPPTPTDTRIPKGTIALDYTDMLKPRKQEQDPTVRKKAVDSLFKNMCLGMQKRGTLSTQTEIFTYTKSQQRANRRAACGGVSCGTGQSCDEFPFASTVEGGSGAIGNCIESLGNSIQGGFLGSLLKDQDIQENEHYELRLSNIDCSKLLGLTPRKRADSPVSVDLLDARQQETSGLTSQLQNLQMLNFSPFTEFEIYNHSIYMIGDLSSGQYTVDVQVTDGIVDEVYVVDYQGFAYASYQKLRDSIDPPLSLPFTLSEDAVGITLLLSFLIDYNVSASMTATVLSSSPNSSNTVTGIPTGTSAPSSSGTLAGRLVQGGGLIVVATIALTVLLQIH